MPHWRRRHLGDDRYLLTRPDGRQRIVHGHAAVTATLRASGALVAAPPSGVEDRTPFYALLALVGVETDENPEWGNRLIDQVVPRSEFPLPFWAQVPNAGHEDAALVGRLDEFRTDGHLVLATGSYDNTLPETAAAIAAIGNGSDGVSIDVSYPEGSVWECTEWTDDSDDEPGWCSRSRERFPVAAVGGATQVGIPAFAVARVSLTGFPDAGELTPAPPPVEPPEAADTDSEIEGVIILAAGEQADAHGGACCDACAAAQPAPVVASGGEETPAAPEHPPAAWFADPGLDGPTPLHVGDDGRVYGHIATWDTCHTGYPSECVTPPRSPSGYRYFRTGVVRTAEGGDVPVGQLTVGGGHAGEWDSARTARAHYDDATTAWADVACGEDEYGIWVAGAVRPGLDAGTMRSVRATAPSGDWRGIDGRRELIAALNVPVQGFPVPRLAASAAAGFVSLVAAGRVVDDTAPVSRAEFAAVVGRLAVVEGGVSRLRSATSPLFAASREAALTRARTRTRP